MLRRHLTPALILFAVLLACCCLHQLLAVRPLLILLLLASSSAAAIVLLSAEHERLRRAGILLLAAGAGFLMGNWLILRMERESQAAHLPFPEAAVSGLSGYLLADSVLSSTGDTLLRLRLTDATSRALGVTGAARGNVLVRLRGDYRFSLGQKVALTAPLVRFDSKTGESFTARLDRKDLVREGYSSAVWSVRAAAREWIHRAVSRAGYPASALIEALLIGAREDVPADLYDAFRRTGSLHILALSGLHVGVLYALLVAILGFLHGRLAKLLIATLVLAFYQVLAGFMPSLLRATIMIVVGGIGFLLDRDAEPVNLLAVSGVVVLLASPFEAFSLSFQLSYVALGGIFVIGPLVQRLLAGRLPRVILAPLAMSVGAQVATFPLIAAKFGIYYPSGLLASLVLVPLTTAVLWGALAWLVVLAVPWPLLHDLGTHGFSILYRVIAETAAVFGRLPGIPMSQPALPWALVGSLAVIGYLSFFVPARRRHIAPTPE